MTDKSSLTKFLFNYSNLKIFNILPLNLTRNLTTKSAPSTTAGTACTPPSDAGAAIQVVDPDATLSL